MDHKVKHDLEPELAKRALEKAWDSYKDKLQKYNPQATWVSDSQLDIEFSVKGFDLKGSLRLVPGAVDVHLDVPLVLRVFKKQAIELIDREIGKWISRAKNGELD